MFRLADNPVPRKNPDAKDRPGNAFAERGLLEIVVCASQRSTLTAHSSTGKAAIISRLNADGAALAMGQLDTRYCTQKVDDSGDARSHCGRRVMRCSAAAAIGGFAFSNSKSTAEYLWYWGDHHAAKTRCKCDCRPKAGGKTVRGESQATRAQPHHLGR